MPMMFIKTSGAVLDPAELPANNNRQIDDRHEHKDLISADTAKFKINFFTLDPKPRQAQQCAEYCSKNAY
jgi:hypothetical protein